ncbi:MAG: hypothetical protein WCE84_05835 [Candidatus Rhabdochlamydia sp.]
MPNVCAICKEVITAGLVGSGVGVIGCGVSVASRVNLCVGVAVDMAGTRVTRGGIGVGVSVSIGE